MGKHETKAMFFDVDGTLVSFKTHRIPQSTVDALTEAHSRGVRIYISTGRPPQFITNLGQIEDVIDGWVTTNGANCYICRAGKRRSYTLQAYRLPTRNTYSPTVMTVMCRSSL